VNLRPLDKQPGPGVAGEVDAHVTKPRLLDLFCGAGGCARGYQRAGFYVVGVDNRPQPRYAGDEFVQADALEYVRDHGHEFDAIHASPVCKGYSHANNIHGRTDHPMQIADVREALEATGLPYVIENVEGARKHMRDPVTVCGLSLGLNVRRHRLFECNFPVMVPPCGDHRGDWLLVFGHTVLERGHVVGIAKGGGPVIRRKHTTTERGREAMGIDWMTRDELSQAIPPAYCELIGGFLLAEVQRRSLERAA
jgi:DNA (cytosine-5)-methyltransferase 1